MLLEIIEAILLLFLLAMFPPLIIMMYKSAFDELKEIRRKNANN